ncbi:MAG: twin-arginine translocase subunit TatB [Alphaproteobacteria bacterium]|nr:twin-arginine translocase subunit TatB [Alphaproteobacteria bacterium]
MFVDLSWSHMLLVLVVALVVVGPKDLPKVMHAMGRWAGKARAMADQFRKSFDEMARQSELDDLRKELDELRNARPFSQTERTMSEALRAPEVSLSPEAKADQPAIAHEEKPPEPSPPAGDGHEPSPP